MLNRNVRIGVRGLLLVGLLMASLGARASGGSQVWLTQTLKGTFWAGATVQVEEEMMFDHGLLEEDTLFLVGYQFCPWVHLAAGHRLVRARHTLSDHMRTEQRPTVDLTLISPELLTLQLVFRSRFEWRDRDHHSGYMRYRERLRLKTSWNVTEFQISPYVSCEVFFEDKPHQESRKDLDQVRTDIGLSFHPIPSLKDLTCNIYYRQKQDKAPTHHEWRATHVWGLHLLYSF